MLLTAKIRALWALGGGSGFALGQTSNLFAGIAAPHHRQIVELPSLLRFVQESAT